MTSKDLFNSAVAQLTAYDKPESEAIIKSLFESKLNISMAQILANEPVQYSEGHLADIDDCLARLNQHEPIQYILNEAYFYGRNHFVDERVLIPRPETEELVKLVLDELRGSRSTILDIGCGSGCIATTLALELPLSMVHGADVNSAALAVTSLNAQALGAKLILHQLDVLREPFPIAPDVVVSNPPYVLEEEKSTMGLNVLNYEPAAALFVPDTDPLQFYHRIIELCQAGLNPGGTLYFEINERFGAETSEAMQSNGFEAVNVVKDLNGKDRFVKGKKTVTAS